MTNRKKFIKRDDSLAPLRNLSWKSEEATVFPDFSFTAALELINNDPVARGALTHFVDKCMEGDYSIIKRESRVYDRLAELRLEEQYMFRTKVLRKIYLLGKLFNNVFIEIVRTTEGKTKALNVLDSGDIEVDTKINGDLIKCTSKTANPITGKKAEWLAKDIVWLKFGDRTAGWAPVDMRAIWENLLLKSYVNRYVAWLWKTGQYRIIYKFKKSSNQDITDFLAYARKNDDYYNVPFVAKGELETGLLRDMKEITYFTEKLKYLDSQTLILMRIPPIDAGIPDASGRSNADAQSNNIESTVTSFKKTVQDYVNFDLFPKINKATYLMENGPMNRFAYKQAIGVANDLKDLGLSEDAIKEYLSDTGIFFESKELFTKVETDPINAAMNKPDANGGFKKKDFGEGNKPQPEITTREDQLKKL